MLLKSALYARVFRYSGRTHGDGLDCVTKFQYSGNFELLLGGRLPGFQLAYETWGALNEKKDNAILLFSGLSASSHARSHHRFDLPGWWEAMIGQGEALDTNKFFVICANHLGSCFGSTGAASLNPETGKQFGPEFPPLMIRDMARAAHEMVASLGIQKLHGVIGTSLGGMLSSEYAACFPDEVANLVTISATGRTGPQSIAFRYVQRLVILNDPRFNQGWYYDQVEKPSSSMVIARQIGNITYRSREEWNQRFGRRRTGRGYNFGVDFHVESYLDHMGHKLGDFFDANSFLFLSKAMDLFSLGWGFSSYHQGVERIKSRSLVIGVTSDILFPLDEQESLYRILASAGVDARLEVLDSSAGHDAFLVDVTFFHEKVKKFFAVESVE